MESTTNDEKGPRQLVPRRPALRYFQRSDISGSRAQLFRARVSSIQRRGPCLAVDTGQGSFVGTP